MWLHSNGVIVAEEPADLLTVQREGGTRVMYISFPGELFLRIMCGISMPLTCSSIIAAVGGSSIRLVAKLGFRALLVALLSKVLAAATGVFVAYALSPGSGVKLAQSPPAIAPPAKLTGLLFDRFLDGLRNMFPSNVAEACVYTVITVFENPEVNATLAVASPPLSSGKFWTNRDDRVPGKDGTKSPPRFMSRDSMPQWKRHSFKDDDELYVKSSSNLVAARPYGGQSESAQTRLHIKGGKIVNDDVILDGDVYIEDGIIRQVGKDLTIPGGTKTIEAKGKLVIPGGIDVSTHFQLPLPSGIRSADDFYTGTRAAVAGGTTMIVDCVLDTTCSPLEAFEKWKSWADEKVCCDYGLQLAVTSFDPKTKEELETLVKEKGVNTFRAYLSMDSLMLSDVDFVHLLEVSKHLGALTTVHAENGLVIAENQKRIQALGITGPEGVLYSQPEEAKAEATLRAIVLANQVSTPLLVSPVMSKGAADVIVKKRNDGCVVFGEPTAASLGTDGSHYFNKCWAHAAAHVTSPPLSADPSTAGRLMDLLGCGDLHTTGSHHCTYTMAQKAVGCDNFTKIPHGVNGVEERMLVVWEKGVMTGKMDACRFVAVTSTNAAKLFNMYPKKGRIQVGSDADVVIWDPKELVSISKKSHNSVSDFNIFEGLEVRGGPCCVVSHGHVVLEEGQLKFGLTKVTATNYTGLVCFGVLVGLVLAGLRDHHNVVLNVFVSLSNALMTASYVVMWYSPVAICSVSAGLIVASGNLEAIVGQLFAFVLAVAVALALHALVTMPGLLLVFWRRPLVPFLYHVTFPLAMAFGTSSR
ncbi:putative Ulip2 protein [Ixodes scapularis]